QRVARGPYGQPVMRFLCRGYASPLRQTPATLAASVDLPGPIDGNRPVGRLSIEPAGVRPTPPVRRRLSDRPCRRAASAALGRGPHRWGYGTPSGLTYRPDSLSRRSSKSNPSRSTTSTTPGTARLSSTASRAVEYRSVRPV